ETTGWSRAAGLGGAVRSSADGGAPASALAPTEGGAMRSKCTWPNETASWNASANSARYAPNLERDRNQLIVVTLRAPDAPAEPFCWHARELCYSVTMPTIGPRLRFIWRVAKKSQLFRHILTESRRTDPPWDYRT